MSTKTAWLISTLVTFMFIGILSGLWYKFTAYENHESTKDKDCHEQCANLSIADCDCIEQSSQLINKTVVAQYLAKAKVEDSTGALLEIPTGLFVQSLKFSNSSEVSLSGYIWQHYNYTLPNAVKLNKGEIGFIFPEQVNAGNDISPKEVHRESTATGEIIGWYFEVTLRQPFDYSKYPFDHKTVWLRMWPKDFTQKIVLTPDLEAYKSTDFEDKFGMENSIVLGSWKHINTFFNYKMATYDTNFGRSQYALNVRNDILKPNKQFPELHMNFVLKRNYENAFVIYLLPILLIASLLFGAMLTISNEKNTKDALGFNAFGFIGAASGLFFVLMLAHIQLRQEFAGTNIVYLEYFYIFMYTLLVLATANAYLFSIGFSKGKNFIMSRNNLIPKTLYWPFFTGSLVLITWYFVF